MTKLQLCSATFLLRQDKCHPQTIEVCRTRAEGLGLDVIIGDEASFTYDSDVFGVLVQQPATDGSIKDYRVCLLSPAAKPQILPSPLNPKPSSSWA